jgi:protein regulator of cytokinesis 1
MNEIQALYDELYLLWNRLGVSDEEADEFVELWKGCEEKCIEAYKAELARMHQVKAENMVIFIAKEREEIVALWDALFFSDAERANFPLMESGRPGLICMCSHS